MDAFIYRGPYCAECGDPLTVPGPVVELKFDESNPLLHPHCAKEFLQDRIEYFTNGVGRKEVSKSYADLHVAECKYCLQQIDDELEEN